METLQAQLKVNTSPAACPPEHPPDCRGKKVEVQKARPCSSCPSNQVRLLIGWVLLFFVRRISWIPWKIWGKCQWLLIKLWYFLFFSTTAVSVQIIAGTVSSMSSNVAVWRDAVPLAVMISGNYPNLPLTVIWSISLHGLVIATSNVYRWDALLRVPLETDTLHGPQKLMSCADVTFDPQCLAGLPELSGSSSIYMGKHPYKSRSYELGHQE